MHDRVDFPTILNYKELFLAATVGIIQGINTSESHTHSSSSKFHFSIIPVIRLFQEIYHFIKDIFKFLWILQSKSNECQANLTQEMVYLHYKMNYGRSYFSSETLVKKKRLLPFVLSQLGQIKFFFHFQQEIFCLLFLKELSRKGFRKYRHIHSQSIASDL